MEKVRWGFAAVAIVVATAMAPASWAQGTRAANGASNSSQNTNGTQSDGTTKGVMSGGSGTDENAAGKSSLGTTGSTNTLKHSGARKNRLPGGEKLEKDSKDYTVRSGTASEPNRGADK